ncbi:MAG: hypothetical protein KBA72_13905 [Thermoanaerobaculia bacterium]|jgi:hypothetical protein|nr:hypothetical protein [Thermoanaerobaculia bacterium]
MRPLAKLLALAVAVALLLPGLAAAFAACAMADCPMMDGGGAGEHDCCPPAPATVSMDCCDHAPTALAAVSVLPERDPAAIVALVGGSTVAVAEPPVDMRFLPDRKEPRPPLDCLARTCVLRN